MTMAADATWAIRERPRPDGKVVTIYYYNDDPLKTRYIAATIWDPATVRTVVGAQGELAPR